MDCGIIVNSVGLGLDIVGAALIFKFGIPQKLDRDGAIHLTLEGVDEEEKEKVKKYDLYSHTGIILLILGFFLQLLSNFL